VTRRLLIKLFVVKCQSSWPPYELEIGLIDAIRWASFISVVMCWLIICLNIYIFTLFVKINILLIHNHSRTLVFWETMLSRKIIEFLSELKHQVHCHWSRKMYKGQVMITCAYLLFDVYCLFLLQEHALGDWVVHIYSRRLQCCNWVHGSSKLLFQRISSNHTHLLHLQWQCAKIQEFSRACSAVQ